MIGYFKCLLHLTDSVRLIDEGTSVTVEAYVGGKSSYHVMSLDETCFDQSAGIYPQNRTNTVCNLQ